MSFLTTQPEELAAAAGKLETIGSAMVAQNAAAAAPTTTGVIPAAADEISVLQAPLFTAYGTLYQQVSAEAAAVYDLFVKTLGVSAGTYAATEAANSSAAASPLSGIASILGSTPEGALLDFRYCQYLQHWGWELGLRRVGLARAGQRWSSSGCRGSRPRGGLGGRGPIGAGGGGGGRRRGADRGRSGCGSASRRP